MSGRCMIRASPTLSPLPEKIQENYEQFLDDNFHEISRRIRADYFFGWLRSRGVFNQDDQEYITNKFYTEYMKAGALIDMIKLKGRNGFTIFMEILEYEYSELYSRICGVPARPPPTEFRRSGAFWQSANIIDKMGELINHMSIEIATKTGKMANLQKLVDDMKLEQDRQMEEHANLSNDLDELTTKMEDISRSNHELNSKLTEVRKENEELHKQLTEARTLKDKYSAELLEALNKPYTKDQLQQRASEPAAVTGEIRSKKREGISIEDGMFEKWMSGQTVSNSDDSTYQQPLLKSIELLQNNIAEVKRERDQYAHDLKETENMLKITNHENESLKTDCQCYQEQFRVMADMIKSLKREIDTGARWMRPKKSNDVFSGSSKQKKHKQTQESPTVIHEEAAACSGNLLSPTLGHGNYDSVQSRKHYWENLFGEKSSKTLPRCKKDPSAQINVLETPSNVVPFFSRKDGENTSTDSTPTACEVDNSVSSMTPKSSDVNISVNSTPKSSDVNINSAVSLPESKDVTACSYEIDGHCTLKRKGGCRRGASKDKTPIEDKRNPAWPSVSSAVTPTVSPVVTPVVSPDVSAAASPDVSPVISPVVTPDVSPRVSQHSCTSDLDKSTSNV